MEYNNFVIDHLSINRTLYQSYTCQWHNGEIKEDELLSEDEVYDYFCDLCDDILDRLDNPYLHWERLHQNA